MKALNILKHKWISGNVVFDKRYNENIRYLKYSEELINKAIKELEELQNRSCNNCEYYSRIGSCDNKESMMFDKLSFDSFCCNKWESKD